MFEPARRMGSGPGSDAMRRLMTRPIRTSTARAQDVAHTGQRSTENHASADLPPRGTAESSDKAAAAAFPSDAELQILKAVLRMQRDENANLRACLGLDRADETLGEEARAVHERWARLVEVILRETSFGTAARPPL